MPVEDELRAAVRSHEAAVRAEDAAEAALASAKEHRAAAKTALDAAIVKASKGGMRQVDIVKETEYTRERVRQIVRATESTDK